MTQGTSGTFAINGTELLLQPTEHRWMGREVIGYSGNARPFYPAVREYELTWELMSMAELAQLVTAFQTSQQSGSVVVDLPKYGATPYQFYSYSGCQMQEPTVGVFFNTYVKDVSLLILKVRT